MIIKNFRCRECGATWLEDELMPHKCKLEGKVSVVDKQIHSAAKAMWDEVGEIAQGYNTVWKMWEQTSPDQKEVYYRCARVALPYLQIPLESPDLSEIDHIYEDIRYKPRDNYNFLRAGIERYIEKHNDEINPKPVDTRREKIARAILFDGKAVANSSMNEAYRQADRILASLDAKD